VSIWGDIVSDIADAFTDNWQDVATNPASAQAAGLIGTADALAGFFGHLTDGKMWMSLGWILLGAIIVFMAVVLWLKKDGALPDVAPIPVPV
jgi:hypothetical protein